MSEISNIDLKRVLPDSQNWNFLRERGLEYLQELSSKIWTDYNVHDPGVTQLEVLCYVLTDLGYRMDFEMKDILTQNPDLPKQPEKSFHTARQILTTKPVTITDYRKLLIDVKGIKNAWLSYCVQDKDNKIKPVPAEVPLWAACKAGRLIRENEKASLEAKKDILTPLLIRGLWKVMLEFDEQMEFTDMNSGMIQHKVYAGPLEGITLQIDLDRWEEVNPKLIEADKVNKVLITNVLGSGTSWTADWEVRLPGSKKVFWNAVPMYVVANMKDRSLEGAAFANRLTNGLEADNGVQIAEKYKKKIIATLEIVKEVSDTLQKNRNLCEDYISIRSIDLEDIAFCADVDLEPGADLEEVLAEMYRLIDNYLSPPVRFYSLKELLDKNIPTEHIFEGPTLKYGFLLTEDVENSALRRMVYTSDIINLLMDIKGVIAIKNVMITKYDADGKKVEAYSGQRWEIPITLNHKPRLNRERSKFLFFKNRLPMIAKRDEAESKLRLKKALDNHLKLKDPRVDLPVPSGKYRNLSQHFSIQQDFPQVYGVGKIGLPPTVSIRRKAQARQLKAYLNFFDQILANYFKQLSEIKSLFSWDEKVQKTYSSQYLHNIKSEGELTKNTLLHDNDFYVDATVLENDLDDIVESQEVFLERRNRFLDHLMARFSEEFNDYALLMYSIKGRKATDNDVATELIKDKINFLEHYPELSSERAKAFNYCDKTGIWDTSNVAGLKKRVSKLLGFTDYIRQDYCQPKDCFFITQTDVEINPGVFEKRYGFEFKNEKGDILLFHPNTFERQYEAQAGIELTKITGQRKQSFKITENAGKFDVTLEKAGEILAQSKDPFDSEEDASKAVNLMVKEFRKPDIEGFHLIEHILLRPRSDKFDLMGVCLDPGCKFCGEEDPYSFRVSIVLPYWPERFQNMDFRNFVEQLLRQEAPAHVFLKICWISQEQMCTFEKAYEKWLMELCNPSNNFHVTQNNFLAELEGLRSIFPMATLHDCTDNEQENDNRVFLGNTILGTYNFDENGSD